MIELVEFNEVFLQASNQWLNDFEIQEMIDASPVTFEEQKKWYSEIKSSKSYEIWGILYNNEPIGACGLKNITSLDAEYWGYIGENKYWGQGLGFEIIKLIEIKASEFQLEAMWLKVLISNNRAIKLYIKSGFKKEFVDERMIVMRKNIK